MRCVQLQQLVGLLVAGVVLHVAAQAVTGCPGLQPGPNGPECGRQCQLAICDALADFYHYSQLRRESNGRRWNITDGWETARDRSCLTWVDAHTGPEPAYCGQKAVRGEPLVKPRFPQLECCNGTTYLLDDVEVPCLFAYAPANLTMKSNSVNGSLSADAADPSGLFGKSITTLMQCGLMVLDLTSNAIGGSMNPAVWGTYTNLRQLLLGSNWISGETPHHPQQARLIQLLLLMLHAASHSTALRTHNYVFWCVQYCYGSACLHRVFGRRLLVSDAVLQARSHPACPSCLT
jgi:hypothetical protein